MSIVLTPERSAAKANAWPEKRRFWERAGTALSLGVVAFIAYKGERNGMNAILPEDIRMIVQSCAHPVLGFMGYWGGTELAGELNLPKIKDEIALASAGAANFATEFAQDHFAAGMEPFYAVANQPETAKDLAFAMMGAALFVHHSRQPADTFH